jgi:hypothetical protein
MNIKYNILTDEPEFVKRVTDVLSHKNGWRKYNFTFSPTTELGSDVLKIELKSEEELSKDPAYRSIPGLSGYKAANQTVSINTVNWDYGHIKSNMENMTDFNLERVDEVDYAIFIDNPVSSNDYKNYVINHEVGHHLQEYLIKKRNGRVLIGGGDIYHYRPHVDLTDGVMPVMLQLTKGKKNLQPFRENYFPLDITDKYNEFYNIVGDWNAFNNSDKLLIGGGACVIQSLKHKNVRFFILLVTIIAIMYMLYKKTKISEIFVNYRSRRSPLLYYLLPIIST